MPAGSRAESDDKALMAYFTEVLTKLDDGVEVDIRDELDQARRKIVNTLGERKTAH
jgi:hypothetical protein